MLDVDTELRAVYVGEQKPYFLTNINNFIIKVSITGRVSDDEFAILKEELIKQFPELRGKVVHNAIENSKKWKENLAGIVE